MYRSQGLNGSKPGGGAGVGEKGEVAGRGGEEKQGNNQHIPIYSETKV